MAQGKSNGAGDLGQQRPQVPPPSPAGKPAAAEAQHGDSAARLAEAARILREFQAAETNRGESVGMGSSGATELPAQFGRYLVKKKLGAGGMGTVYLVENTELEREEALKVPHFADGDDPQARERFLREARSAAKLDHANLCPVYDVGVLDGIYYLTMRFLNGKLLSEYTGKAQPPRKVVEIVIKLAQALEAAHGKGVIHRDLKPRNVIMVGGVGPVLMDFGLASQVQRPDQKLTQAGSMLGTPDYMPPEQVNGELERIGPPSDVYSLGVILYELLTGRLPFQGTVAAIFGQILYIEPPWPSALVPGLNAALDGICRKAMAKAPTERYLSMKVFETALKVYLRSTTTTDRTGTLVPAAADKAGILHIATAPPGPPDAGPMPQQARKSSPPTLDEAEALSAAPFTADGLPRTIPTPKRADDLRGKRRKTSYRTIILRMACLMLLLVLLAGLGWLIYTGFQNQGKNKSSSSSSPYNGSGSDPGLRYTPSFFMKAEALELETGQAGHTTISISKKNFDGDVTLDFEVPKDSDLRIPAHAKIEKGKDRCEIEITAGQKLGDFEIVTSFFAYLHPDAKDLKIGDCKIMVKVKYPK